MAAAISPGLGKTCAQKNKQNKQKNGGIIAQQMAGREAQDVLLQTLNAAIFDVCPLLPPLLSSRGDWEGLEPAGFGMGHTRELTRDVICIFMGIRTPKLQSAHLRLKDAQGKDSRAPRQSPRGEGGRRAAWLCRVPPEPLSLQVPWAGGRLRLEKEAFAHFLSLPGLQGFGSLYFQLCPEQEWSFPNPTPQQSRVPVSLSLQGQAPGAGTGECSRDWTLVSLHQTGFRLHCHSLGMGSS